MRGNPRHLVYVFGRHRLFEPEGMVGLEVVGDADGTVSRQLAVGADADFELVADRVSYALEYLRRSLDFPEGDVPGYGVGRRERVYLARRVALFEQLCRDLSGGLRVVLERAAGHVGVGTEGLVVLAAEQVVDRLIGRLSSDVP